MGGVQPTGVAYEGADRFVLMVDIYSREARRFFKQYQQVRFEDVHGAWLVHLPEEAGAALDVGAGSGRDAAALADAGWEVIAVEPAAGLNALGAEATLERGVQWLDDRLPDLAQVRVLNQRFDLVLVSAVWMHVPPADRERAFRILAGLLAPEGLLVITLRHGPSLDERQFFDTSREELEGLARTHSLTALHAAGSADMLGRQDVAWETLVFRLPTWPTCLACY